MSKVSSTPPGADIEQLLAQHADTLAEIKQACADIIPSSITPDGVFIDDIFFLRYLLSNQNRPVEVIKRKIQFNLDFRTGKDKPAWLDLFTQLPEEKDRKLVMKKTESIRPRLDKSNASDITVLSRKVRTGSLRPTGSIPGGQDGALLTKKTSLFSKVRSRTLHSMSRRKTLVISGNPSYNEPDEQVKGTQDLQADSQLNQNVSGTDGQELSLITVDPAGPGVAPIPLTTTETMRQDSTRNGTKSTEIKNKRQPGGKTKQTKAYLKDVDYLAIRHPLQDDISEFLLSTYTGDFILGMPISVVRLGKSDLSKLMEKFGSDVVSDFLTFEKEKIFRVCDLRTRESGKLVKSVTVLDFAGFSLMSKKFSRSFLNCLGSSSSAGSKLYPQMQFKTCVVNIVGANMILSLISKTMSKSVVEKIVACKDKSKSSQKGKSGTASSCPFITKYEGLQALPDFLGGTSPSPNELLPPEERVEELEDGTQRQPSKKLEIHNRRSQVVKIDILEAGVEVIFEASVATHHVMMSAVLRRPFTGEVEPSFIFPPRELRDSFGTVKVTWKIPTEGTLEIKFDNSFSRIRHKKVTYKVDIIVPKASEANEADTRSTWFRKNFAEFIKREPTEDTEEDERVCAIM